MSSNLILVNSPALIIATNETSQYFYSYCISIASGSGRTLIFQDGKRWTYNATWSEIFNPISNCSYDKHKWVDLWFDVMIDYNHTSNKHSKYCTNKRILYIATDEPKTLVNEANKKWGNRYRIYHSNLDKLGK
uniref:FUT8_N_cat domain-containing protein n=1 Tax=Meloidogyne hapla TaxID=6305 RepID=A0A1I8BWS0_MELHA